MWGTIGLDRNWVISLSDTRSFELNVKPRYGHGVSNREMRSDMVES
jgi:hypothetical protein